MKSGPQHLAKLKMPATLEIPSVFRSGSSLEFAIGEVLLVVFPLVLPFLRTSFRLQKLRNDAAYLVR